jgi:hypothetical protein
VDPEGFITIGLEPFNTRSKGIWQIMDNGAPRLDFIKVDVEGFEMRIVRGTDFDPQC